MAQIRGNRRALLYCIRQTDQRIAEIYERAAEELAKKAGAAKKDSLTERWAKDYETAIKDVIGDMRQSLGGTIKAGAKKAAGLPGEATADWLGKVASRAGVDGAFRSVLSSAPTDALRSMLTGRMYSDGKTLSSRIWNATGRLEGGIEEVVAQGIAQKRSAFQLARDLEQFVNPNEKEPFFWNKLYPKIPFPLMVEYNAQRLARTAINHAYWGANRNAAEKNPMCQGMKWLLSESHILRQVMPFGPDICDVYAEHDEGLGKGVYPIDKLPMPHPQCLCTQAQEVPDMDEAVDRLNRWLDGGQDKALTKRFEGWKRENEVDKNRKVDIIESREIPIPHSLGAKSTITDEPINVPGSHEAAFFTPGTRIKNVEVFAGKGTNTPIRERFDLEMFYKGSNADDWEKAKGIASVEHMGEEHTAEVHWYYEANIGGVEYKIKRQKDGRLWIGES